MKKFGYFLFDILWAFLSPVWITVLWVLMFGDWLVKVYNDAARTGEDIIEIVKFRWKYRK